MISLQEYQLCDVSAQDPTFGVLRTFALNREILINISMLKVFSIIFKYLPLRLLFDAVRR